MQHIYKKISVVLLLVFLLSVPGIASAATQYFDVKVTINGRTETIKVPIDLDSVINNSKRVFRYIYTYKDGKWILTSPEDTLPDEKPSQSPTEPPAKDTDKSSEQENDLPDSDSLTQDEEKMLNLVNEERKKLGLDPLKIDMRLVEVSRKKSKDMIVNNYFGHTSPVYGTPFDALKANGISYRYAGENLAGAPTVERAHNGLMNSPGHRANILNPNYTHIGIGVVEGGPYGKMFTQTFIGIK